MRRAQQWMLGTLCVALLGFAAIATDDVLRGPLYHGDVPINQAVSSLQDRGWPMHAVGDALTRIGDSWTETVVVGLVAFWMWMVGQRALAAWGIGIGVTTALAVTALKELFRRTRPSLAVAHGYSFPSGHTLAATAALGSTIILATECRRRTRGAGHTVTLRRLWATSLTLAAVLAFLTGVGRVLAQQHWLSDVMASWCLGLALAAALLLALSRVAPAGEEGPRAPPPKEDPKTP